MDADPGTASRRDAVPGREKLSSGYPTVLDDHLDTSVLLPPGGGAVVCYRRTHALARGAQPARIDALLHQVELDRVSTPLRQTEVVVLTTDAVGVAHDQRRAVHVLAQERSQLRQMLIAIRVEAGGATCKQNVTQCQHQTTIRDASLQPIDLAL